MFDSPSSSRSIVAKKRANLMSLSREFSDSEKSVRSQYTVSSMEIDGEKHPCEKVWKNNGYFGELKTDFILHKKDFPENSLLLVLKNPPASEPENSSYLKLYSPS